MIDNFLILLFLILLYTIVLFFIKKFNIGKKITCKNCTNCCPKCNKPLTRIRRNLKDHLLIYLTFKLFDLKRYKCHACSWKGLRWENKFEGSY